MFSNNFARQSLDYIHILPRFLELCTCNWVFTLTSRTVVREVQFFFVVYLTFPLFTIIFHFLSCSSFSFFLIHTEFSHIIDREKKNTKKKFIYCTSGIYKHTQTRAARKKICEKMLLMFSWLRKFFSCEKWIKKRSANNFYCCPHRRIGTTTWCVSRGCRPTFYIYMSVECKGSFPFYLTGNSERMRWLNFPTKTVCLYRIFLVWRDNSKQMPKLFWKILSEMTKIR